MNPLERLQLDLEHCLLSMQLLNNISITAVRPRGSAEALSIQTKLNNALAGLIVRNGKRGCAIIVGMPTLDNVNPSLRSVKGELSVILDIIENPMINEGADGTGLTAEELAWTLATTIPQTNFAPHGQIIADKQLITPKPEAVMEKRIEYRVILRVLSHSAPVDKCGTPVIERDGYTIDITSDSPCYYTLDGSYPGPGNPAAILFEDVITQTTALSIRAAAHDTARASSDVVAVTFSYFAP